MALQLPPFRSSATSRPTLSMPVADLCDWHRPDQEVFFSVLFDSLAVADP